MLKPEVSIPVAAGVVALVFALHQNATPPMADIRVSTPGTIPHANVDRAERQATWASVAVVSAVSLLAKDPTIFVVGGLATVGMSWWTRYNNQVLPSIGKVLRLDQAAASEAVASAREEAVNPNPYGHLAVM